LTRATVAEMRAEM